MCFKSCSRLTGWSIFFEWTHKKTEFWHCFVLLCVCTYIIFLCRCLFLRVYVCRRVEAGSAGAAAAAATTHSRIYVCRRDCCITCFNKMSIHNVHLYNRPHSTHSSTTLYTQGTGRERIQYYSTSSAAKFWVECIHL